VIPGGLGYLGPAAAENPARARIGKRELINFIFGVAWLDLALKESE